MPDDLSQCTIHLVGHAHIDLGCRWRWNETVHRIARGTFRGVLRFCEETNHLEERIVSKDVPYEGSTVRIAFKPYEIKTLRLALLHSSLGLPDAVQEEEGRTFGA